MRSKNWWYARILIVSLWLWFCVMVWEIRRADAAEPVKVEVTIERVTPDTYRIWWIDHGTFMVEERQGVSGALDVARRGLLRDVTAP